MPYGGMIVQTAHVSAVVTHGALVVLSDAWLGRGPSDRIPCGPAYLADVMSPLA